MDERRRPSMLRRVAIAATVVWTGAVIGSVAGHAIAAHEAAAREKAAEARLGRMLQNDLYHGGRVQHDPRVDLVFWGPGWQSGAQAEVRARLAADVGALSGSPFTAVLSQYRDAAGPISPEVRVAHEAVDPAPPPASVSGAALDAEAASQVAARGWTVSPDDEVVVVLQAGSGLASDGPGLTCGRHGITVAGGQAVVDAGISQAACQATGSGDAVSRSERTLFATFAHEYAEMTSDPDGDGWQLHFELADLCQGAPLVRLNGRLSVPQLYDARQGGCTASPRVRPRYSIYLG